jgi:glycosyltransferase involved in cell wall biosynthesis
MSLTKGPGGHTTALVHDWLNSYVGGERVLEQMISLFPQGELFVTFDNMIQGDRTFLSGREPVTSFLQKYPLLRKNYTKILPLLMLAVEQLDVSEYDIVLSSSSCVGKGVLTRGDQLHIAYVHSPMRYAWDMQHQYLRDSGLTSGMKGIAARMFLHWARMWDQRTANGVDHFIANSHYVAQRIWRAYRRESRVIYPPVQVGQFELREKKEDFYLAASRLVPYKKMVQIVQAFSLLDRRLVVIGDGPQMSAMKAAAGPNIEILGYQPTAALRDYMQRARAFVFAAEEDFGITPVEAQSCGTPVIAFGRGGALETIRGLHDADPTGVFFASTEPKVIADAVVRFELNHHRILPQSCRSNAERFSVERFRTEYTGAVEELWAAFPWKCSR